MPDTILRPILTAVGVRHFTSKDELKAQAGEVTCPGSHREDVEFDPSAEQTEPCQPVCPAHPGHSHPGPRVASPQEEDLGQSFVPSSGWGTMDSEAKRS